MFLSLRACSSCFVRYTETIIFIFQKQCDLPNPTYNKADLGLSFWSIYLEYSIQQLHRADRFLNPFKPNRFGVNLMYGDISIIGYILQRLSPKSPFVVLSIHILLSVCISYQITRLLSMKYPVIIGEPHYRGAICVYRGIPLLHPLLPTYYLVLNRYKLLLFITN